MATAPASSDMHRLRRMTTRAIPARSRTAPGCVEIGVGEITRFQHVGRAVIDEGTVGFTTQPAPLVPVPDGDRRAKDKGCSLGSRDQSSDRGALAPQHAACPRWPRRVSLLGELLFVEVRCARRTQMLPAALGVCAAVDEHGTFERRGAAALTEGSIKSRVA